MKYPLHDFGTDIGPEGQVGTMGPGPCPAGPPSRVQLWERFEQAITDLRKEMNHDGYTFDVEWKIEDINRKKK